MKCNFQNLGKWSLAKCLLNINTKYEHLLKFLDNRAFE